MERNEDELEALFSSVDESGRRTDERRLSKPAEAAKIIGIVLAAIVAVLIIDQLGCRNSNSSPSHHLKQER